MPRMCVGPPAISRSAPPTSSAVAVVTGTQATSQPGWLTRIPAAIASAIWWVLPNTLSYTITVRIVLTSDLSFRFQPGQWGPRCSGSLVPDPAGKVTTGKVPGQPAGPAGPGRSALADAAGRDQDWPGEPGADRAGPHDGRRRRYGRPGPRRPGPGRAHHGTGA